MIRRIALRKGRIETIGSESHARNFVQTRFMLRRKRLGHRPEVITGPSMVISDSSIPVHRSRPPKPELSAKTGTPESGSTALKQTPRLTFV